MKKRLFALLIALTMLMSATALADVNTEGYPIVTEPITLTAAVCQSPIQGDFNEMVILKNFVEQSGINVEFQNIPSSDVQTQLSLMLASGEVPDILMKMSVSGTDQAKYSEEGMFVALTDYEDLMPNLNKYFTEFPTAKDAVTMPDGKVYSAPYILTGDAIRCGAKWWFNTDVLSKLGLEAIPTTLDDLYAYLVAAKALDYNENGQADEIPLTAGGIAEFEQTLAGSFGLMNRGSSHTAVYVDEETDELKYGYNSNMYREMLKFLNKLYAEKLLDQDIFTMDYAQLIAKASTGRALTYVMVNNSPVSNSPYEQYTLGYTEPFTGYNGEKMCTTYSLPASTSGQFLITYKCAEKGEDYVKAAVRWMDHWYSDEGIISYFMGVEGVTYEKDETAPGGLKLTDMVLNSPDGRSFEQVLAEYVPWAGGANPSVASNEYFKGGETWPVCLDAVEGLRNYFPETVWAPFNRYYTTSESSEMSAISTDLETYRAEWRAYFITGQKDINSDADWAEFVNGFEGMNLARYMEIYQKGYEAYKAEQAA